MRNTTIGIILALVSVVAMAQSSGSVHVGDVGEDETASLTIRSAPRDSRVIVDGAFKDVTPTEIQLSPGEHTIRITHDGYEDVEFTLTVEAGDRKQASVELAPKVNGTRHGPFVDHGDGTITDMNSGLMWAKEPEYRGWGYTRAANYCEDLTLGGFTDWRLPTVKDFNSLYQSLGELESSHVRMGVAPFEDLRFYGDIFTSEMGYWTSSDTDRNNHKYGYSLWGNGDEGNRVDLNSSQRLMMSLTNSWPVRGIREH